NQSLKALLGAVSEPSESSVTARVVADTGGSFAQSVLILAGTVDGAGKGDIVLTGEGLVGRITQAGRRSSRVLLITDINSRIPVLVGEAGSHAILAGDNSLRPKLLYMDGASPVLTGDKVVTSGDGDAFPTGLPVGRIARIKDGVIEVEPYVARDQLRHVKIADYGLSGVLGELARER
ncbi:MAG: rod shape-determining protein MreC, partial [Rhodobacteraceae bacterium]|nr:rod shape-determining protein MreC [Paracoccaceae bacterium]